MKTIFHSYRNGNRIISDMRFNELCEAVESTTIELGRNNVRSFRNDR